MPEHKLCVPCLFGLEGPLGNELRHMGLRSVMPENGRVRCTGTDADIARINLRCRFGERVLLELGSFPAPTFDALFEGVKALPWAQYLPADAAFPVKGYSLESALHSVPDCQKIIKKAVVESLKQRYHVTWFAETGALYQIQFSLVHDTATLYLDTTGTPLHKRGYRPAHVAAPLRETLAAALVDIAGYRGRGDFCDPFCGSGTIAIEAALAAKGRAPGIARDFAAMQWAWLPAGVWPQAREEARAREFHGEYHIFASDIDPRAVAMARDNARRAGVDDCITFAVADAREFDRTTDRGVIVTNPPYGERLMEKREAEALYTAFGAAYAKTEHWRLYLLSSHTEFERAFGRPADKKRKLYNGTLNECVNGAVGHDNVAVTHFPCGTGNDFIKMFGEEKDRFFDLSDLVRGEVRPLDVMECCGRYAVNICSVGIDARIGTEVHQYHDSYVLSAVANLFKGIAQPLTVRGCGMDYSGGTSLICACNGRFYGGGFNPITDSRPDNGKLEFLVVRDVSRLQFIRLVGKYAKGRYRELEKFITHLEGGHLEIDSEQDLVVNIDGEALWSKHVNFDLIPGGVNFLVPANMAFFHPETTGGHETREFVHA